MSENRGNILKWRFDISTFQLIGRELITDRVTALFELVKNSYDANARKVTVTFENVQPKDNITPNTESESKIIIEDDGCGMSFEDVRDKWMVIGTSSKRRNKISPAPFYRRCVGEKGIGRFAVDKLGSKVNIITKKKGEEKWLNVEIDWNKYADLMESDSTNFFTDVENVYIYEPAVNVDESGTKLIITDIRETWKQGDVEHFINESARITSPFIKLNPSFRIRTIAKEFSIDDYGNQNASDLALATLTETISYSDGLQESLQYNEATNTIDKILVPIKVFGGINLKIYYFEPEDREKYRRRYKFDPIDGIKIYRDGMLATPFVETEKDNDNKRDILGIDKRVWANIFDKISSRQFIGILDITKDENPMIIDATNRQDFIDNEEYREMKEFIILQLQALERYRKQMRERVKGNNDRAMSDARNQVSMFASTIADIAEQHPQLKEQLQPVVKEARNADKTFARAIKLYKDAEKEYKRKESTYLGIISLRAFSIDIAHSVRTAISKISSNARFFVEHYPNPQLEDKFCQYAKEMYDVMKTLNRIVDYELSYSQSNIEFEDVKLAPLVVDTFAKWSDNLKKNGIDTDFCNMDESLTLKTNRHFFVEIFDNLIDNSIKAMKKAERKVIKISIVEERYNEVNQIKIRFSDTGCGIPMERWDWVFGIYNTTTEAQGGAGVGLYIVRTRINSLKGKVVVVDSEFGDVGTTIEMTIPLNY